jgi:hypothetical protein
MKPFLFTQTLVLERPRANGQCSPVRALKHSLVMQRLQVFADGNERCAKTLGQIAYKDSTFVAQQFEDFPAAFLVKHQKPFRWTGVPFCFLSTFSDFRTEVHKRH